jgi:predicted cupin superfamily sugar epimerase
LSGALAQSQSFGHRRPMSDASVEPEVHRIVHALGLAPHPEGGYFHETFRSRHHVGHPDVRESRAASTAIYYLLPRRTFSAFHRVRSDEVWHHYDGGVLELHVVEERDGAPQHHVVHLGRDLEQGERPQHVVRAGVWQAARPRDDRFVLAGCTVAPGFEFADFEMPHRAELLVRWPSLRTVVETLTRP